MCRPSSKTNFCVHSTHTPARLVSVIVVRTHKLVMSTSDQQVHFSLLDAWVRGLVPSELRDRLHLRPPIGTLVYGSHTPLIFISLPLASHIAGDHHRSDYMHPRLHSLWQRCRRLSG